MQISIQLNKGQRYNINALQFCGWTIGDGTSTDGYGAYVYFAPNGEYLGPDEHGIEPLWREFPLG